MISLDKTTWRITNSNCSMIFNGNSEKFLSFLEGNKFRLTIMKDNGEDCNCFHTGSYSNSDKKIFFTFDDDKKEREVLIKEYSEKELKLYDTWDKDFNLSIQNGN